MVVQNEKFGQPIRLLIIEDDCVEARQMVRLLRESSLALEEAVHVDSLAEAFQCLQNGTFDGVLLDLHLPDASGLTTVTKLRAAYPGIPIVISTGSEDEVLGLKAIAEGADDYLVKEQYDHRQLARVIRYAIERKVLQKQRDRERENLVKIFEVAPVGMLLLDEDTIVKQANSVVGSMILRDPGDLIGQRGGGSLGCVHSIEDPRGCGYGQACPRCTLRPSIERVLRLGESIHDVDIQPTLMIHGQEIRPWLSVSAEPLLLDGKKYVVVAVNDVTDRKETEVALRDEKDHVESSNRQLERMNLDLEAIRDRATMLAQEAIIANQVKSQFLSNMSHEIRTPLNAVLGFTDVLSGESLTDQQQEYVDIIRASGEGLLDLVNSILEIACLETDKYDMHLDVCVLQDILTNIETLFAFKAADKGLAFAMKPSSSLPSSVCVDAGALRQCLVNLIDNAIKFTDAGRIDVQIGVQCKEASTWLSFAVQDTGIGIPQEKQDLIFEPFLQGDGASTRRHGGTGLGLAITKRLVGLMGGRIGLTSQPGEGSCFTVKIPVNILDETETCSPFDSPTGSKGRDDDGEVPLHGHILVAEDSRTNARLVEHILVSWGLQVTVVEDGQFAVDAMPLHCFDAILMDIQMPRKDGYQATLEIREQGYALPIIALTANATQEDRDRCMAHGFNAFMAKPFQQEELKAVLKQTLCRDPRSQSMEIAVN